MFLLLLALSVGLSSAISISVYLMSVGESGRPCVVSFIKETKKVVVMCTRPIQLTRINKLTGQSRIDVVPCGKCEECRGFKRSEFAALSIHQALVSGTLFFFTLTYDDAHVPISITELGPDNLPERFLGFDIGVNSKIPIEWWYFDNKFHNHFFEKDGLAYACSLRREDVKNWIKTFRVKWLREKGVSANFKYAFFGELGEFHGRPHYHGLFFGLTAEMANMLAVLWREKFGFVYCVPPDYRQLSADEIGAVSNYVSKYISKGINSRFEWLTPYIEKPRKICSQNFGSFSEDEIKRLRAFYDGHDLKHLPLKLFLEQLSSRRSSLQIAGRSYPLPQSLKNKLFYDGFTERSYTRDSKQSPGQIELYTVRSPRKTQISAMVSKFTRDKHNSSIDDKLRQNSLSDSVEDNRRVIRQILMDEQNALQGREELAKKNLLTNLKSQKDGQ